MMYIFALSKPSLWFLSLQAHLENISETVFRNFFRWSYGIVLYEIVTLGKSNYVQQKNIYTSRPSMCGNVVGIVFGTR